MVAALRYLERKAVPVAAGLEAKKSIAVTGLDGGRAAGATVQDLDGRLRIGLQQAAMGPFERRVKRLFDLVVGSIFLILALPLLGVIAVAIRLDSPGPVLFRQQRVGENGKQFGMFKFRSMVDGAEAREIEQLRIADNGQPLKCADDPRVTRVGRFIRRASIDELPQLLNVLRGEMSLVGPRPELPWIVAMYEPWQYRRLDVPQGMTGWWQVNGRSDKPMYLHTEEDIFYIENYSFLLDLRILGRTAGAVIRQRGAY